ncbi:CASP-like protein PIMP1 isoform X2 [Sesamum indicum]|uniref:CASP-like protein n=1 Tax=Sesamum indicum TaxID=4182 RepID=A0A8M8UUR7_SESIN|nr:CASP-like protein PIMP1 isoform X2 [Sesamum indicum]
MKMPVGVEYDDKGSGDGVGVGSKFPVTALTARLLTLLSLIISVVVLKTNDKSFDNGYVLTYKDFRSYKYMFYVTVFGIGYTLLQIPFALYFMLKKKHLITSYGFLKFNFYADKCCWQRGLEQRLGQQWTSRSTQGTAYQSCRIFLQ